MSLLPIVIATVISAVTTALGDPLVHPADESARQPKKLLWQTCDKDVNLKCADFKVDFDYRKRRTSNETFTLPVIRLPAVNRSGKLGSIFVNPGGPGLSGRDFLVDNWRELRDMTGGYYDLISWDPRGVSASQPQAHCFNSASEEREFWANTVLHPGPEAPGNFWAQQDITEFLELAQPADQVLLDLRAKCMKRQENLPETLSYVGTVATVKDMLAIHEAHEGTEKLNFWGFSYGTLIGLYFVSLFPQRVGHFVLEGIVDPEHWANKPPHMSWSVTATNIDIMLEGFAAACLERPKSCSFGKDVNNHTELLAKFENLLNLAYEHKKLTGNKAKVSSSEIRKSLLKSLPNPKQWIKLSDTLSGHYSDLQSKTRLWGITSPFRFFHSFWTSGSFSAFANDTPDYSFQAITCGDAIDSANVTTKDVFGELARVAKEIAPRLGPAWGEGGLYCHQWPYRAVERLEGSWTQGLSRELSKPLLILGNTIDPVTPYNSAQGVARVFDKSAVLVTQEAYGHIPSWGLSSDCTTSIVKSYFVNGTLPSPGVTCEVFQNPFPDDNTGGSSIIKTTWKKLFSKKRSEL
ncbi:unnamed protein product [Rhizoctonia solani]|uniref:Uncharacterized protein n=1 Tax=Rhizoctonia solani TaxID=456999 RepID=A0A8H3GJY8_9AGAM|nr:unnamed protein product [Rhizoctonia solani]